MGDECESIKIPQCNSAYVPNLTNTSLFLLDQDHIAMNTLLVLRTELKILNQSGSINRYKQTMSETTVSHDWTNKPSHNLTCISSNTSQT
jgi:hypothetical protein